MLKTVLRSTVKSRSRLTTALVSSLFFNSVLFTVNAAPARLVATRWPPTPSAALARSAGGTARGHSQPRTRHRREHPTPTDTARAATGFGGGFRYAKQGAADV